MKLSVVIITGNEEKNIAKCLECVKWADEIIVVDALSDDRTAELAKGYTDKVISRKWVTFLDQRIFALGLATCEFVLIMDADEVLDEKAQIEIKNILRRNGGFEGYQIIRDTYFLGKRLVFSEKPNPVMRLFKKKAGFVSAKPGQKAHEDYKVHGRTKLIGGRMKHYTAQTIAERLMKIDRYSTLWAEERAEQGQGQPAFAGILYAASRSFIGNFFIKRGYLDGMTGFLWCSLKAFENFLKFSKLWEKTRPLKNQ